MNSNVQDYHDFSWPDMPIERRKRFFIGDWYINAAICPQCNWVIRSRNRHDYRTCKCGALSVDGGSHYLKRSWSKDINPQDIEDISIKFTHLNTDENPD